MTGPMSDPDTGGTRPLPSPGPNGPVRRLRPSHHRHRQWAIPLGKIAGIRISLHLTFFLLVLLVVVAEAQPGGLGVVGGLVWLVLLFACVLVHELAHSVLARAKGAHVRSIVLLPIGGVSQIDHMPEGWSDEFAIALVGPLASIGLAALFFAASAATGSRLVPIEIWSGPLLPRMAWTNLVLGLFNMLPAFPLDGGRVFRAALERRHDVRWATRRAATVGRWLGFAMVVVGFLWDFWLAIIGLFVVLAATAEAQATMARAVLQGVAVRDLMRTRVATLDARTPLASVGPGWWSAQQVITQDGRYVGMAEPADLQRRDAPGASVGDVTDREAPGLPADADVGRSALDQLIESGYRALPVVEDGAVIGVLVLDDVASWLTKHPPAER